MQIKPIFQKKHKLKSVLFFAAALYAQVFAQSEKTISELEIQARHARPGKMTICRVSFVTPDTLTADAVFILNFPENLGLDMLEIADSRTIDGGLKIEKKNREARISRGGLGKAVLPGTRVEIEIGLVKNPSDLTDAPVVTFTLKPDGTDAVAYSKNVSITFQKK